MRYKYVVFLLVPVVLTGLLFLPVWAQDNIILTIALEEWQSSLLDDSILADFYAENPGVSVVSRVTPQNEDAFYGIDTTDIETSLKSAEAFASLADVLLVNSYQLSVETVRAGYFLDLTPLINSDSSVNMDDFYPAALRSFQYDGSTWGLPVSSWLSIVIYNKTAFDNAGLSYPDESWTVDQYMDAGVALTQYNAEGKVTLPGFSYDERVMHYLDMGQQGAYDPNSFPEMPLLDSPQMLATLAKFADYRELISPDDSGMMNVEWDKIPMTFQGTWRLSDYGNISSTDKWAGALLPGNTGFVSSNGFAVSAGTNHPELAYKLINYLTSHPTLVNRLSADIPARRSVAGIESPEIMRPENPPEVQALIDKVMVDGVTGSELRYLDYIWMLRNPEDSLEVSLKEAQELALDNMEKIAAMRQDTVLMIPTPVPTPVLAAGEVSLRVMYSSMMGRTETSLWDNAIAAFTASDPEVRQIVLQTQVMSSEQYDAIDCYISSSLPAGNMDYENMLPVDPLIASDATFHESDVLPGLMDFVRHEGKTLALPMSVEPGVLWYDASAFASAGVPEPFIGWNANDFEMALRDLKRAHPDMTPLMFTNFGNTNLLALMAAYDRMPVDYTQSPAAYQLTDPGVVESIRQVLTLAKDKLISYQALTGNMFSSSGEDPLMYDAYLSSLDWRMTMRSSGEDPYKITLFPRSSQHQPLISSVTVGRINARTQYPEACYRWLRYVSTSPELQTAMPAYRSMIDNPALSASFGQDMVEMYQQLLKVYDANDILSLNMYGDISFGGSIKQAWMNRAFDRFVLEDADLDAELSSAQAMIDEYSSCIADLPDTASIALTDDVEEVYKKYIMCGIDIDPSLREQFSYMDLD